LDDIIVVEWFFSRKHRLPPLHRGAMPEPNTDQRVPRRGARLYSRTRTRRHYFLTYFFSARLPTSAPYTLPRLSTATPSAPLVPANGPVFGSGDMSGMNAVTLPSLALPTRMPRFQSPCFRELFDSESATYSRSSLVMKRPLGRLNCFHSAMKLPS